MKNLETLKPFLTEAKKKTYTSLRDDTSSGKGGENILKGGGKELVYEKDNFLYRDRYYGYNPFLGEEIVFYNKKVIWEMNYKGKIYSVTFKNEKCSEAFV